MRERWTHNTMALWSLFILGQPRSSCPTFPWNPLFNAGYFITRDTASAVTPPRRRAAMDFPRACFPSFVDAGQSIQESVNDKSF